MAEYDYKKRRQHPWTEAAACDFLRELAKRGTMGAACDASDYSRATIKNHRKSDPAFSAAYDDALAEYRDGIRGIIRDRANDSDRVLIRHAESLLPEYAQKPVDLNIGGQEGSPLVLHAGDFSHLDPEKLARMRKDAREAMPEKESNPHTIPDEGED